MNVFGRHYARYYDLLYKDKDYAAEAKNINGLIQKYAPKTKKILEFGCGTGRHAVCLKQAGYSVTGVDISKEMLNAARSQLTNMEMREIEFIEGDIRTIRLKRKFDAVISLFHVMSYLVTNDDLKRGFAAAKAHLNSGGIFMFDCWYGPAVLINRPAARVKTMEDDLIAVIRSADPVMDPNLNIVDVKYNVLIKDKSTGAAEEFKETHTMRYLFKPEVEELLEMHGMKLISCEEWITGKKLGFDTWGALFIAT